MYAFELFVSDEFDIRENSDVDEIEFIRRFKLMGMGVKSKMPTKLTAERVVVVPIQTAAKELGVARGRLRIKSHFHNKKRISKLTDDPIIISAVRNYYELPENSTMGDRTRNIVVVEGLEVQRQYLRKPIDVIGRSFLEVNRIQNLSLSSVKKIVRKTLKHLTVPNRRSVYNLDYGRLKIKKND